MGNPSNRRLTSRTGESDIDCRKSLPVITVGGEGMQPSDNRVILFLKLPATILQTSPWVSAISGPTLARSPPSNFGSDERGRLPTTAHA
jgi:hypothetical protein